MMRLAWVALAVLGVASLAGCSSTSTCNRDPDETTVCNAQGTLGPNTWFSADYRDPTVPLSTGETGYQYFPPARTITFQHELGSVPNYQISLAFSNNGSLAPTAGNQAIIECMDNHVIQIKNDTCSDFYIWLQLEGSGIAAMQQCDIKTALDSCPAAGAAGAPASSPADDSAGAGGVAGAP